jgi:hypothetical protein
MSLAVQGSTTYGKLGTDNLFIVPVSDAEVARNKGYYLWKKRKDGYAEVFRVTQSSKDCMIWERTEEYSPQRWPNEAPVIQIG